MSLAAGRHQVKIKDYAEFEGQDGKFGYVQVTFVDANENTISWRGYLSDAAFEGTSKRLDTLGLDWNKMQKSGFCLESGCLDLEKIFEIIVEEDTWQNKTILKVVAIYRWNAAVSNQNSALKSLAMRAGKIKTDLMENF